MMRAPELSPWHRDHSFGQDVRRPGEPRTLAVAALAAATMIVELVAGWLTGSMALLADGLHMGAHVAALGVTLLAYRYARRHAHDARYNFGTGKLNSLGGYTNAVLLGLFAVLIGWESVERLVVPSAIAYDEALWVAAIGLVVNLASAWLLGGDCPGHGHPGEHAPGEKAVRQKASHGEGCHGHEHGHDHNLRAAYLHVVADALTSVLAIGALLAGKYAGLGWLDPVIGLAGGALVASWSLGLLRESARVLVDRQAPEEVRRSIREAVERDDGCQIVDLHVWSIGPRLYAAELVLIAETPLPPRHYKWRLPRTLGLAHVIVEVHGADEESYGDDLLATVRRS